MESKQVTPNEQAQGEQAADSPRARFKEKALGLLTRFRMPISSRGAWIELLVLAIWSAWLLAPYFDFNPRVVPGGREFGSSVQTHHLWENVKACGYCAFWNGSERGGVPAFADIHGSMLHPVVALATLAFGVVNGSKIALAVFFWLAGVGQWWLARLFNLSRLPRMWSAMLAIAGGHLAGRMDLGAINVVLATSACSLIFPAVLTVHRNASPKNIVLLGAIGAGAVLAGSGYMQVGLISAGPAFAFLLFDRDARPNGIWKAYALSAGLALLLSSVFLLPFIHFSPNFTKGFDPGFNTAQTIGNSLINLVVNDPAFYMSEALGKVPYPYLYTLFIGWTAVILAAIGVSLGKPEERPWFLFLIGSTVMIFLTSSAITLRWLADYFPGIYGVKHPPQIAGLAIPPILALAAYGLERVLRLDWPTLRLEKNSPAGTVAFSTAWFVLIPLALNLLNARAFAQTWIFTEKQTDEIFALLDGLRTPGLEWVNPPFGEHYYVEAAVSRGLKLSPGIMSWGWKDRDVPVPALEAVRFNPPPDPARQVNTIDGIAIYERTDQPYAAIYDASGNILSRCTATGRGGIVDVRCEGPAPGKLIVRENAWTGWLAWNDEGGRTRLLSETWLEIETLPGLHVYRFRYIPWDATVGILLSLTGAVLCLRLWRKDESHHESRTDP